jgi:sulfur-oxidizing protein SoxY
MMKKITISLAGFMLLPVLAFGANDEQAWNTTLKNQYFADKSIVENADMINLETPYRAEDPALVPLTITSKVPQTAERYIKKILVLVDNNPFPFVAEFELTPESGKADLSMRVRVNTYSFVRAIAEMNTGELFMTKQFVKASGGCSAPIGADMDAAMLRLGKMKFKLDSNVKAGEPTLAQLLISHPNVTGMQMDQVTRFIKKSHFVEKVSVTFADRPVLTAKTDIAISSDPNFRFYFVPKSSGILKAEITDMSCESPISRKVCTLGNTYSQTVDVKL